MTIEWPSGIVQNLHHVAIDQTLLVIEAPDPLAGDYNRDGRVDAADYTVWRDRRGQTFALPGENPLAATPGLVDAEDYAYWRQHFGAVGASAAVAIGVPEPSAALLALMALIHVALHGDSRWLRLKNNPRARLRYLTELLPSLASRPAAVVAGLVL